MESDELSMVAVFGFELDILMERKDFYTYTEAFGVSIDFVIDVRSHYLSIFEAFLSSFVDCLGPYHPCFSQQFQLLCQCHPRRLDRLRTSRSDGHRGVLGCLVPHLFTGRMR